MTNYALAILAVGAALILRLVLAPLLGTQFPFHTLWAAVAFSAWYCGVGPATVATIIGSLGVWYWFLVPVHSFRLQDFKAQMTGLIAFWVLSGGLIVLGENNRRTRIELQGNKFRLKRLVESNIVPIVCANMERITEANDAFLKMVGYSRDDLHAGTINWQEMTPPEHFARDLRGLEQLKLKGFCEPFEKEYIRKDGSRVPLLIGATILKDSPLEWLCFIVDLSDLKRTEAELRTAHCEMEQKVEERTQQLAKSLSTLNSEMATRKKTEQELRELSARLLRLQDEERRRVARDLHDSTGQTLTAMKLALASLENLVATVPNARKLIDDLNSLTDHALQDVRTTSHLLHPPLLDEAGFSSAARWYVEEFGKRSGVMAKLELATLRLSKDKELAFFRILQESLSNVLRHSGSEAVDIHLGSLDRDAILTVRDYGKGIPSEKLNSFHETGAGVGVGLGGMKQRVRQLGGHLTVDSDSTGTSVRATLPLDNAGESNFRVA
jgi:PAS domain S-box-containing protein